jgi:hypothetical protein
MLFQLKKLLEIINLTRFLKSFWILYINQIIVYNTSDSDIQQSSQSIEVFSQRTQILWLRGRQYDPKRNIYEASVDTVGWHTNKLDTERHSISNVLNSQIFQEVLLLVPQGCIIFVYFSFVASMFRVDLLLSHYSVLCEAVY